MENQKAIIKIDEAIQSAYSQRSKFGAYQNVLQHIENNILNYKINITNAESQICDVDLSKEIMQLKNQQVLLQSSTAILAQASQLTQSILQFLK